MYTRHENSADTLHLQKRGNIWHYYRRTPLHLVPIIGRRFFKKSLKTSCLAEAKKLRTIEDLKCDAQFAAAEESLSPGTGAGTTPTSVSLEVLIEYVRQMVEQRDKRSCAEFATDPPEGGEEWRECLIDTGTM